MIKINPHTVAHIAATLISQGMNLGENSDLWISSKIRDSYIQDYVSLALDILIESSKRVKRIEMDQEKEKI